MLVTMLAACKKPNPTPDPDPDPKPELKLEYAAGTVLRMATGYNSKQTGLFFDAEIAKDGITLADGKTYHTNDLKPTWVEVEKQLGVKFENQYQGSKNAEAEFKYWQDRLAEIDMVSGTASQLSESGVAGNLIAAELPSGGGNNTGEYTATELKYCSQKAMDRLAECL